jgi:hypothetical protein
VPAPRTRRSFLVVYGLWVFGVIAYFVPGATWNPVSRFALTDAIVEHATFSIDALADSTGDRAWRGGHWYSDKAPIPSLLAVPVYAALHLVDRLGGGSVEFEPPGDEPRTSHVRVNRSFQMGLYVCSLGTAGVAGALIAVLLYEMLRARTTPVGALVASASVVLATPVLPYATSFYGHTVAAFFLLAALALVTKDPRTRRHMRLAGACVALAAGCEYLTVVPGLVVALSVVVGVSAGGGVGVGVRRSRSERRTALVDLALGAALPVAVVAVYHWVCFGAPWQTGYSYLAQPNFVEGHSGGVMGIHMPRLAALAGLLFGPRRGLFFVAPAALVGVAALVAHAWRTGDRTSRVGVAAAAAMLLATSGYYMWWGGAAAGPRHLVPVLPVLGFGYAAAWGSPRLRPVLCVLAVASCAMILALTAVGLEAPEHGNVWTEYVWPNLARGRLARIPGASNLGLLVGLRRLASLAPVVLWTVLGFAWLARQASRLDAPKA